MKFFFFSLSVLQPFSAEDGEDRWVHLIPPTLISHLLHGSFELLWPLTLPSKMHTGLQFLGNVRELFCRVCARALWPVSRLLRPFKQLFVCVCVSTTARAWRDYPSATTSSVHPQTSCQEWRNQRKVLRVFAAVVQCPHCSCSNQQPLSDAPLCGCVCTCVSVCVCCGQRL